MCSGCLYLPIIYTKSPTGSIDPSFIKIGLTTKEDVILRCGNPSWIALTDEKQISYKWTTSLGVVIAGAYYTGGAGALEATESLVIDFDDNDVVKSYKITRDSGFKSLF